MTHIDIPGFQRCPDIRLTSREASYVLNFRHYVKVKVIHSNLLFPFLKGEEKNFLWMKNLQRKFQYNWNLEEKKRLSVLLIHLFNHVKWNLVQRRWEEKKALTSFQYAVLSWLSRFNKKVEKDNKKPLQRRSKLQNETMDVNLQSTSKCRQTLIFNTRY